MGAQTTMTSYTQLIFLVIGECVLHNHAFFEIEPVFLKGFAYDYNAAKMAPKQSVRRAIASSEDAYATFSLITVEKENPQLHLFWA